MAAKKNDNSSTDSQEAPKDSATPTKQGVFCKTCQRDHMKNLDGPGIGHWPFEQGTDAETMFNHLASEPTFKLFIPLAPDEKFGSLATPIMNGLKVGIYKGAYVDCPKSMAELVMDSLNQTQRITVDARTTNPETGFIKPARLDLRNETDKGILNA